MKQDYTINVPLLSSTEMERRGSTNSDKDERDWDARSDHSSSSTRTHRYRRSGSGSTWAPRQISSPATRLYIIVIILVLLVTAFGGAHTMGYRVADLETWKAMLRAGGGIEQATNLDWSDEIDTFLNYEWVVRQPHASLTKMIDALTKEESNIRSWLLATRPTSQAGTPVGMAQTSSPRPIRAGYAMAHVGAGPGEYSGGSEDKWSLLLEEWESGRTPSKCKHAPWMDSYAKLHHDIISGKREPKILEVVCRKGLQCGGSSDRLLGVFSSLLYGVLTDRALLITWEDLPFELFFDAVKIDFAQPEMPISRKPIHPRLRLDHGNSTFLRSITPLRPDLDHFFSQTVYRDRRDDPAWVQLMTNRGVVLRSFTYPDIEPVLRETGFDPTTAYACLSDFLFRPKPNPLQFITQYSSLFSLPTVFSITIQVRTGDDAMTNPEMDKRNTIERHSNFFTCADIIAKRYAQPDQKVLYYLVTDSHTLEEDALKNFPDKVVITGLSRSHPEIHSKTESAEKGEGSMYDVPDFERRRLLDGTTDALTENWIIGKTDFQILSFASGFGKLPVFMKGQDKTTISLVAKDSDKAFVVEFALTAPGEQDCSNPDSLSSLAQLATSWSLG